MVALKCAFVLNAESCNIFISLYFCVCMVFAVFAVFVCEYFVCQKCVVDFTGMEKNQPLNKYD